MARGRTLEEQLAALGSLRGWTDREAQRAELARQLESKRSRVVAKAAQITAELLMRELEPAVHAAWRRVFEVHDHLKADKGCSAKLALVQCLRALDSDAATIYEAAAQHRQLEPVFGGREDTAIGLRCEAALGLVDSGSLQMMPVLTRMLTDREPRVRAGTAAALGTSGDVRAVHVLHLMIHRPDPEPEVRLECFAGLLALSFEDGLTLAGEALQHADPATVEAAALALGGTRRPEAFEALHAAWSERAGSEAERPLLLGLSLLRQEATFDLLLELVAIASQSRSEDAEAALALHGQDPALQARLEQAIERRNRR